MSIPHTSACQNARANERKALAAYEKEWPNYCRECGGEGGRTDFEYRGECHGTPAREQVYNYCPACIGQGRCPRCAISALHMNNFSKYRGDEPLTCYHCGWTEGMPGAPEVLNDFDCGCFDDALEARQDVERELFRPNHEQY